MKQARSGVRHFEHIINLTGRQIYNSISQNICHQSDKHDSFVVIATNKPSLWKIEISRQNLSQTISDCMRSDTNSPT